MRISFNRDIVLLIIILLISIPIIGFLDKFYRKYLHICIYNCDTFDYSLCKKITYDHNGESKKNIMDKPCIINLWNISHIIYYAILSYIFYNYRFTLFLIGILWELLEYLIGHNNNLDILWNIIGIIIGTIVKNLI